MKKSIILLALILISLSVPLTATRYTSLCCRPEEQNACCCDDRKTSRSFMYTRPVLRNLPMEQSVWRNIMQEKKSDLLGGMQIIGLYQQSIPLDETGQYFLIDCKNKLLVSGDTVANSLTTRDVRAEWLGLPNNFRGELTLNPEQRQMGGIVEFHQHLKSLTELSFFQDSWVSISLPFIAVQNNMNLRQHNVSGVGANNEFPRDIIQAFNQPCWQYGRIVCERTAVRLAEINIKLGKTYLNKNDFLVSYYSVWTVPTGNEQDAKYTFDAVAGNNGHLGIGAGVNFQIPLNNNTELFTACWFLDMETIFHVHNKQFRTFDLFDKPWSRYLLYNRIDGPPNLLIPGTNALTHKVLVRPFNNVEFATGLRIKAEYVEFECGYSLWGHGDECIEYDCPFPEIYGIAGDATMAPGPSVPVTASGSTIAQQAANDAAFTVIRGTDLNLDSAAAQSATNHKIHWSLGVVGLGKKIDGYFSVGGFYEWPQRNTALQNAGFWGKAGATF